jgi:pyridoxine 4-dehydrogenase
LVHDLQDIAKRRNLTPAQLAIAWTKQQSRKNGNPEIIPIPGATTASRVEENSKEVTLSSDELAEIDKVLGSFEVQGSRYPEALTPSLDG